MSVGSITSLLQSLDASAAADPNRYVTVTELRSVVADLIQEMERIDGSIGVRVEKKPSVLEEANNPRSPLWGYANPENRPKTVGQSE